MNECPSPEKKFRKIYPVWRSLLHPPDPTKKLCKKLGSIQISGGPDPPSTPSGCAHTLPPVHERSIVISVSVYLHVRLTDCLCLSVSYIQIWGTLSPLQWLRPYFARSTGAEYCDRRVCLSTCPSDCLSVCTLAYLTNHNYHKSKLHRIFCGRGSILLWRRCDMLCTSIFCG